MLLTLLSIGLLCSTLLLLLLLESRPLGAIVALEVFGTLGVTAAMAVVVVGTAEAEVALVFLLEMIGGGLIDGRRGRVRV